MWYNNSPAFTYRCFLDLFVRWLTIFTITKSLGSFSSFVLSLSIPASVGWVGMVFEVIWLRLFGAELSLELSAVFFGSSSFDSGVMLMTFVRLVVSSAG